MITPNQKEKIEKYLQVIGVSQMEFFEECYDHIASSFEQREAKELDIDEHIRVVVQPSFGGVTGIRSVMVSQEKLRQKMLNRRFCQLFVQYLFRWPTVLITAILTAFTFWLNKNTEPATVLMIYLGIGALSPVLVTTPAMIRFYLRCKKEKRPYKSSDVNRRIGFMSYLGVYSMNILITLIVGFISGPKTDSYSYIAQFPSIQIPLAVLYVVYALVVIQLFKEKFQIKLAV